MQEKRRALRYIPGHDIRVAIRCGHHEFSTPLSDLSASGLMTLVPEQESRHLADGAQLCGEIQAPHAAIAWEGHVVHHSPSNRGVALGIEIRGNSSGAMRQASEWLSNEAHAGALQLRRTSNSIVLDVIGRLSFEMSRDFLFLARRSGVTGINLSRCTSLDSAGLGMLSIARDLRLSIEGARHNVGTLLEVARIAQHRPQALARHPS